MPLNGDDWADVKFEVSSHKVATKTALPKKRMMLPWLPIMPSSPCLFPRRLVGWSNVEFDGRLVPRLIKQSLRFLAGIGKGVFNGGCNWELLCSWPQRMRRPIIRLDRALVFGILKTIGPC